MQQRARAAVADEVQRFIATGASDPLFSAWEGRDALDRMTRGDRELLDALVDEARRRAGTAAIPGPLEGIDLAALTRRKVEPMVRGLFPKAEQDAVLALVERSVVVVTLDTLESAVAACAAVPVI